MNKHLFIILSIIICISIGCKENIPPEDRTQDFLDSLVQVEHEEIIENTNLKYSPIETFPNSAYLMMPIQGYLPKKNRGGFISKGGYYEKATYKNIIFYHPDQGTYKALFDSTRVEVYNFFIYDLEQSTYDEHGNLLNAKDYQGDLAGELVFYEVTHLDEIKEDYTIPIYLYASDRNGNNLTLLSPLNESVVTWEFPNHKNHLIITTVDIHSIKENSKDEHLYQVDLSNLSMGTPIFEEGFENQLKAVMN